jgi:hypothetical protein
MFYMFVLNLLRTMVVFTHADYHSRKSIFKRVVLQRNNRLENVQMIMLSRVSISVC